MKIRFVYIQKKIRFEIRNKNYEFEVDEPSFFNDFLNV